MKSIVIAALASTTVAAPWPGVIGQVISQLTQVFKGDEAVKGPFAPFPNTLVQSYVEPLEIALERNTYVTRAGSELQLDGKSWTASGANVYWLGLDENVQPAAGQPFYAPYNASYPSHGRITEIMNTLNVMGARAIRSQTLGVSVGNPLSLEPELDVFNDAAFDTIDWSVYQAREHGLRIFAPLTDNYDYYHGGKYDFLRWRGINISSTASPIDGQVQQFYTDATIIGDFKNYIKHLLTHVNPYTGLSYADDPTIFAYETGNELGGPVFGDQNVPASWVAEISSYIKELAPHKLVIDGTYGVNDTHLNIPSVDIFDDHFYPLNLTKLTDDIARVGAANKVFIAGEYDWTGNQAGASSLQSFYDIIERQQNASKPVVSGDLFWSLFMHDVPDCTRYVNHSDGFALQYGNAANTAHNTTQIETIRTHFFIMMEKSPGPVALPLAPCPGPLADLTYQ